MLSKNFFKKDKEEGSREGIKEVRTEERDIIMFLEL